MKQEVAPAVRKKRSFFMQSSSQGHKTPEIWNSEIYKLPLEYKIQRRLNSPPKIEDIT
jgi:hypothetical protein